MRRFWCTFGAMLLSVYASGNAPASDESDVQLVMPASMNVYEVPKESESAAEAPKNEEVIAQQCPAAEPWKLPQPSFLKNHGIVVGGWLEQGYTANGDNPSSRFNGPQATNDRAEYQLNQFWVYLYKPTQTDGCGWDLGGRIDACYGTDWRFGNCTGLESNIDDPNNFYGLILPQFYAEVAVNDLTVKMGHFATFTSLEVVPAPMNFFYSHTYLMGGYFDPLLVTGLQADYKLNDYWTVTAGFNRGWLQYEDQDDKLNFLGGVKWASDEKRSTLSLMVDAGPQQGFTGMHDRTSVITVYTLKITERLQYGSQYNAGIEKQGSFIHPGEDASWYGTEQLFTYTLNQKWSLGLRYEWVRDNDGSRIAGVGTALHSDRGWDGLPGLAGAYNDLTLGLNYRPNRNWVIRPEVRWDWYDGQRNSAGQLPYGDDNKREQFTAAVDAIVTF